MIISYQGHLEITDLVVRVPGAGCRAASSTIYETRSSMQHEQLTLKND